MTAEASLSTAVREGKRRRERQTWLILNAGLDERNAALTPERSRSSPCRNLPETRNSLPFPPRPTSLPRSGRGFAASRGSGACLRLRSRLTPVTCGSSSPSSASASARRRRSPTSSAARPRICARFSPDAARKASRAGRCSGPSLRCARLRVTSPARAAGRRRRSAPSARRKRRGACPARSRPRMRRAVATTAPP